MAQAKRRPPGRFRQGPIQDWRTVAGGTRPSIRALRGGILVHGTLLGRAPRQAARALTRSPHSAPPHNLKLAKAPKSISIQARALKLMFRTPPWLISRGVIEQLPVSISSTLLVALEPSCAPGIWVW